MFQIRRHISNVAALVLLVWLFACGSAIAQNCLTHADAHHDSVECCATVQAATVRADAGSEITAPAPMQPFLVAPLTDWSLPTVASNPLKVRWPPSWQGSGPGIPIVFLRLAL
jgi:hypothetical protein